ncbi:AmmeMemoRadiSam system protein B [Methanomethylophilus alvi]|uniref:AmmeMemoRadiSam system protein B n=1 Tax=Methanomethylophilus alvi TaxID=1291540 RepID=UPI0037DC7A26
MRIPAVAGTFYPSDPTLLRSQISQCFREGPGEPCVCSGRRAVSAVLSPHAGYLCSGTCAAYSFRSIAEDGLPEAYIVIGPDHYGVPYESVMCSEEYVTPFGRCEVHEDIAMRLRELIPDDVRAHTREHSVEVEVPFIQYIDPKAKIVPIIMGRQSMRSAERLAQSVKAACSGHDVVIIASSDLVHYVPKPYADEMDSMFMDAVASGDVSSVYRLVEKERLSVCGYGPIAVAMMLSGGRIEVLDRTDSFESIGYDRNSVVGYGSAVMYKS